MKKWTTKKAIDYSGRSVNGFAVVRRDESHDRKANIAHWRIKCERCGSEKVVQSTVIRTGKVGECSCKKQDRERRSRISHLVITINELRSRARQIEAEIKSIQAEQIRGEQ